MSRRRRRFIIQSVFYDYCFTVYNWKHRNDSHWIFLFKSKRYYIYAVWILHGIFPVSYTHLTIGKIIRVIVIVKSSIDFEIGCLAVCTVAVSYTHLGLVPPCSEPITGFRFA